MAMRTEGARLDQAMQRVAKSSVKPAERALAERFAPVWRDRDRQDHVVGRKGLVDIEFDYIMPELSDGTLLRGADYLRALEGLLDSFSDDFGDSDEDLDRWGTLIVQHEIKKFRLLWQYMNGLVD